MPTQDSSKNSAQSQQPRPIPKKRKAPQNPLIQAANEDDDGYAPYQDYMDAGRITYGEEPSPDPWR